MTPSELTLNQRLIKIFQDVLDNRCFELNYDEIQDILSELRSVATPTRIIIKKPRKKVPGYTRS